MAHALCVEEEVHILHLVCVIAVAFFVGINHVILDEL